MAARLLVLDSREHEGARLHRVSSANAGDQTPSVGLLSRAVEQGEWDDVVRILDADWSVLLSTAPELVRDTVAGLPAEVVQDNPRWGLARDYLDQLVGGPSAAATRFRGGVPAAAPRGLLDALAQLTSRGSAARQSWRADEAAAAAAEARTLLDEATPDAVMRLAPALPELQFEWGLVWELVGDVDRATREYVESFDAAVRGGNAMAQMKAAGALAWVHAFAGRNLQAAQWLERLPEGGAWWEGRSSAPAILARALLLSDDLRIDEALLELSRVDLGAAPERWPFHKLLAATLDPDAATALELLAQIDSSSAGFAQADLRHGATAAVAALARSLLLQRLDNTAGARTALEISGPGATTLPDQLIWCAQAAQAAGAGDHAGAVRRVAPIRALPLTSPRPYVAALALTAAGRLRQGDESGAIEAFAQATTLSRRHGLFQPLTVLSADELTELTGLLPDAVPLEKRPALLAHARTDGADPFGALSERERSVLAEVLTGESLPRIASALFVSVNTVKTQLRSIYKKVGVSSRGELEAAALAHGYGGR
jgi:DNA-binding CsgD family transcriptional regulator